MTSEKLGERVRAFRERIGLSTEELAKSAGVDVALVDAIERGEAYPAIGVMVRMARALGQRLGTFVDDYMVSDPLIVRSGERTEETSSFKEGASGHYHYYSLGKGKSDRHMEPFVVMIDPSSERELSSHEGEEFVIVISGELELAYGGEKYQLKEGDSAYYNSVVPHHLGALGEKGAEIYAVIYTPF